MNIMTNTKLISYIVLLLLWPFITIFKFELRWAAWHVSIYYLKKTCMLNREAWLALFLRDPWVPPLVDCCLCCKRKWWFSFVSWGAAMKFGVLSMTTQGWCVWFMKLASSYDGCHKYVIMTDFLKDWKRQGHSDILWKNALFLMVFHLWRDT